MPKSYAPRKFVRAGGGHDASAIPVTLYIMKPPLYFSSPALVVKLVDTLS
jgi:hypothetical protein